MKSIWRVWNSLFNPDEKGGFRDLLVMDKQKYTKQEVISQAFFQMQ